MANAPPEPGFSEQNDDSGATAPLLTTLTGIGEPVGEPWTVITSTDGEPARLIAGCLAAVADPASVTGTADWLLAITTGYDAAIAACPAAKVLADIPVSAALSGPVKALDGEPPEIVTGIGDWLLATTTGVDAAIAA